MNKTWKTPEMEMLFSAIHLLKNEAEIAMFLRDLCTISELTEMSKRFAAVKMVHKKAPIREIAQKTGLSTTTVNRVSQWKNSLGEGGYDLILQRLKK